MNCNNGDSPSEVRIRITLRKRITTGECCSQIVEIQK